MMAWVIGIALVSYLTLVANQNRTTYKSLAWNTCIPVLEAGVEEALGQIHKHGIATLGANQWTFNTSDQRYHKTREVYKDGYRDGSYFDVGIQAIDPRGGRHGPVIYSTGYVPAPAGTGTPMGGETAFGMILGSVSGALSPTPRFVFRTVQVTTIARGLGAINSQGPINFSGGPYVDSFDSSNPNYNDGTGRYSLAHRKANAEVLTNSRDPNAIIVTERFMARQPPAKTGR